MADRKAYFAEYRKRPEALAAQRKHQKKWRKANPKRTVEIKNKYRKDNGGLQVENKLARVKRKNERAQLSDIYLRYMLKKHMEGVVKNIPPEMLEIYRKLLLTKRLLKIKKHNTSAITLSKSRRRTNSTKATQPNYVRQVRNV